MPKGKTPLTYDKVRGYFSQPQIQFYMRMLEEAPKDAQIVEIGAFMGKSTIFLCQKAAELKRDDIIINTVDHFQGSAEHAEIVAGLGKPLEDIFRNNIKLAGYEKRIRIFAMESVVAANHFDPDSLDFVFIDGSHKYEDVLTDIKAWLPKVKNDGGMLSGDDWSPGWPGVQQAVKDIFVDQYSVQNRVWYHRKHSKSNELI